MTTTVAWTSYQNGKPSALSFASDSRLSWPENGSIWDFGRKIFWCKNSPDIFGFAGDVVSQSTVISQVCDIFDYSIVAPAGKCAEERHKLFVQLLQSAVGEMKGVKTSGIHVLHGLRDDKSGQSSFRLWRTQQCAQTKSWADDELSFQINGEKNNFDDPGQFFSAGSGAGKHRDHWKIRREEAGDTSRSVFRALVDVIDQECDPMTGGHPQIVSLGSSGVAKPVGVYIDNERSVSGLRLGTNAHGGEIEWRDKNFGFLHASTLRLKSNAPEHHFRNKR